jgi:modulator of FtsH protease HflK
MSRKDESLGAPSAAMSEGGPWGTREEHAPLGPEREEPRNPWMPPHSEPGYEPEHGPSAFDELMRRARSSFGGNMPGRGGPQRIWPYVAGGLFLTWLGLTCVHSIAETERGLVSKFGSYSRTLEPGMNLTLPAPFETVRIVETEEVRSTPIGATGNEENLLLTRDRDLLDLAYSVRWNISDPRRFAFELADPDQTIRQLGQSAMRAAVADAGLNDVTVWGRKTIEQQVQKRMQSILDSYGAGIHIQDVTINRADLPREIGPAVKAVDAARQARDKYLDQTRAYVAQKAASAQREADAFNDVYAQYKIAPEVTKRRLYYDTMETVLKNANKTIIDANGVTPNLQLPSVAGVRHPATPAGRGDR